MKSNTETVLWNWVTPVTDSALSSVSPDILIAPVVSNPNTDKAWPTALSPCIESLLPKLQYALSDNDEPMVAKSKTDRGAPRRAKLLNDSDDPK
jgi:hypothetical protein